MLQVAELCIVDATQILNHDYTAVHTFSFLSWRELR